MMLRVLWGRSTLVGHPWSILARFGCTVRLPSTNRTGARNGELGWEALKNRLLDFDLAVGPRKKSLR